NYAFLADGDAGLEVLDISNPSRPHLVARHETATFAQDVIVVGNHAFVALGSMVRPLDISNPISPAILKDFSATAANSLALGGNYLYVADATEGLTVLDVSDPANPQRVANLPLDSTATRVAVAGAYALVAAE